MMTDRLHILLINPFIVRCGIARSLTDLANSMRKRGHKVTIITQKPVPKRWSFFFRLLYRMECLSRPPESGKPFPRGMERLEEMYPLVPGIDVIPIRFSDSNRRVRCMRERIRGLAPDVCISMQADGQQLVWAATLLGTGVPFICSERHCPSMVEGEFWNRKGRLAAMSGADIIHLLLSSYADSIPNFLKERVCVIGNAVEVPATHPARIPGARKVLLWLGRMQEELKQCRMALDAFAAVARACPDWDLQIAGDGQDRDLVQAHAATLMARPELKNRITFLGEQKDVWPVYARADALCFSSRAEGLPGVLQEAMASGLPCVAFADCPGVAQIIDHNVNGLLASPMTAAALATTLEPLLADAALRARLGAAARASMQAYAPEKIYDQWEEIIRKAASFKGHTRLDAFSLEPFASCARLSAMARREWLWRDFGRPMPDEPEGKFYYCVWQPLQKALGALLPGKNAV